MNTEPENKNDDTNIIQEEPKTNANEELEKKIFNKLVRLYFPSFDVEIDRTFESSKDFLLYFFMSKRRDAIFCKALNYHGYYYRKEYEEIIEFNQAIDLLFEIKKECGVLTYGTIIKTINEAFGINSNLEIHSFDDFVTFMFHKEAKSLSGKNYPNFTLEKLFGKYRGIYVTKNALFKKLHEQYKWCHKLVEPSEEEKATRDLEQCSP